MPPLDGMGKSLSDDEETLEKKEYPMRRLLSVLEALQDQNKPKKQIYLLEKHLPSDKYKKPDCYKCQHRSDLSGDAHSSCSNRDAQVIGYLHGYKHGWFDWPYNFDPVWLEFCDGFKGKEDKEGGSNMEIVP